jgi:hypothetical protein
MAESPNPDEGDELDLEAESLEVSMAKIARSSERLANRLAPVETRSKWQTIGLALVLVVALAAGLVALENRKLTRSTSELSGQIKDCIDPSGQCYKDSRSRTGDVERRILADQAARSAEQLETVCDLFDGHGLTRPAVCGPDRPDAG